MKSSPVIELLRVLQDFEDILATPGMPEIHHIDYMRRRIRDILKEYQTTLN